MIPQENLSKEQKALRAQEAQKLLQHPLLVEAFANLRANYFEAWVKTPPDKVNDRDRIYHAASVLSDVERHLHVVVSQGRIEQAQLRKQLAGEATK